MPARYAVWRARPSPSNVTKLTPRSTINVCCRAAITWPKPIRRMVSTDSHESILSSTATPLTGTVARKGRSELLISEGASPATPDDRHVVALGQMDGAASAERPQPEIEVLTIQLELT